MGDNVQEVWDCHGSYESFCDDHDIYEIYQWHIDNHEFDNLPPIPKEQEAIHKKFGLL